jgi:hypothetical protein
MSRSRFGAETIRTFGHAERAKHTPCFAAFGRTVLRRAGDDGPSLTVVTVVVTVRIIVRRCEDLSLVTFLLAKSVDHKYGCYVP